MSFVVIEAAGGGIVVRRCGPVLHTPWTHDPDAGITTPPGTLLQHEDRR